MRKRKVFVGIVKFKLCWNFKTIYGARNRVGIGLSNRHVRTQEHRLAVAGRYDISVPTIFDKLMVM
jgi:hypothetical protein